MQFSTKIRYATRAMLELAMNYKNGPMQLKVIAEKQQISEKYLEQIMLPLRTNGFVYTKKGSRGGYFLNRPPQEITLLDIVQTVEGSLTLVDCVDNPNNCPRINNCVMHSVWSRLANVINGELKSVILSELAERQQVNNEETYNI